MTDSQVCPTAGVTALQDDAAAEAAPAVVPSPPDLRPSAAAPAFSLRISRDRTAVLLDCPDPLQDLEGTVRRIREGCQDLKLSAVPDQERLAAMLASACAPGDHLREFPLIRSQAPVPPQDGRLAWQRDFFADGWLIDEKTGAIDFWNRLDNRSVLKDELLVTLYEPVEGRPGLTVLDEKIPVDKPARARLRCGKGVSEGPAPGGSVFRAATSGRIRLTDGTVSVDEILMVKGDVSLETGNLRHSGTIQIEGDVRDGATIEALGDVVVKGMLEPCNITAGGSLTVGGGIVSQGGFRIQVGGDLHARYIHGAEIQAEGDIVVTSEIAHCDIRTRGKVDVPTGRIAGGHTVARQGITVAEAGAGGSADTHLAAGIDPTLKPRVGEVRARIQRLQDARTKILRAVAGAEMVQDTLAEKDRQLLAELSEKARSLQEAVVQAEGAVHQMTREALAGARQEIVMLKELRSGTTIQLGEQKLRVRHSIFKPRIAKRLEDRIRILPLGEGNMPEQPEE